MRKIILPILIIFIVSVLLCSCGEKTSQEPQEPVVSSSAVGTPGAPIQLRALIGDWNTTASTDEARKAYYEKKMMEWAKANPDVYIEIDVIPGGTTAQAMTKLITAASAGNPHDFANIDSQWVGNFHEAGVLTSIDDFLPDSEKSQYFDFTKAVTERDGKLYNLWAETGTLLYYYNKNYTKEAPKTWNDIFSLSEKIHASEETVTPFLTPAKGTAAAFCFLPFYWAQGAILFDPSDNFKPVFGKGGNRQAMIDSFTFIQEIIDTGATVPEIVGYEHKELQAEALAGRVATMIAGSWVASALDETWGYTSLPMQKEQQSSNITGGWTFGFLAQDDKKLQAAVDFVQAVYTSEDAMAERLPLHGYIPTRKDLFDREEFSTPFYKQIYKELEVGSARPATSLYPVVESLIEESIGKIISGETNIESLVDKMYQEVLSQYNEMQ